MIRAEGTKTAKVIAVIETKALRGSGTKEDPTREITQYWDLNGHFLAEIDEVQRMRLTEYDSEKDAMGTISAPQVKRFIPWWDMVTEEKSKQRQEG